MNMANTTKFPVNSITTDGERDATSFEINGMIAIVAFSLLSNLSSLVMMAIIAIKTWNSKSKSTMKRLVMNLLFSGWLQSAGFAMSALWIYFGRVKTTSCLCEFQGFLIQFGDISSGLWVANLCLHAFLTVYKFRCDTDTRFVNISMAAIWSITAFFGAIGFIIQKHKTHYYTDAGGLWCWISEKYSLYRVILHYAVIIVFALSMALVYLAIWIRIKNHSDQTSCGRSKRLLEKSSTKIIYYPATYLVLVFPIAFIRLSTAAGYVWPLPYLVAAGCIFTSTGTVNCTIYGFRSSIFSDTDRLFTLRTCSTIATLKAHRQKFSEFYNAGSSSGSNAGSIAGSNAGSDATLVQTEETNATKFLNYLKSVESQLQDHSNFVEININNNNDNNNNRNNNRN